MLKTFSQQTRKLIRKRANNRCERCTAYAGVEIHHRRPRAMGGSRDPLTNSPANGVLLCAWCHRWVESHRTDAMNDGWLLHQGHDPTLVPVLYQGSDWTHLTVDGGMSRVGIE